MELGPYRIVRELGRGGAGVVFLARDAQGRDVALKLLRTRSADTLARFERERRLLESLGEAEGFVPLRGAGDSDRGPYLVMAFLPGGTLRDRLRQGALTVAQALDLGRTLGRALGRAHELGIVHRDLKPENVLYTADGRPLIADLGLAKHFRLDVPGGSQSVSLTGAGEFHGTIGYMPPEQMAGAEVGPAADVFALGCVLWEALAGRPAFVAATLVELAMVVEHGRVAPLGSIRPDVPPPLVAVLERALHHSVRRRPADGLAFARALEGMSPARRSRLPLVLAAVASAAIPAALALAPHRPRAAPPAAPTPTARAEDRDELLGLAERGLELVTTGKREAGFALLDETIRRGPRIAETWFARAEAFRRARDLPRAISDYERGLELAPWHLGAWLALALCHGDRGELDDAIACTDRALALEPRTAIAWGNRAGWRFQQRDRPRAIVDATVAIALDPRLPTPYGTRASARRGLDDPEGALRDFDLVLETAEGRALPQIWSNRANTRRTLGDEAGAREDYDRALALAPGFTFALGGRADLRARQKDYAGALADLDRAVATLDDPDADPTSTDRQLAPRLIRARARVRSKTGDAEGARRDLERVVRDYPGTPSAAEAAAELR